jgi:hypothetical protein
VPTETPAPTETPEPTATPEPTEDPYDISIEMGLNYRDRGGDLRRFVIREIDNKEYLVDMYNEVPKAVRQGDGGWRILDYHDDADKELMYAKFAPLDREYFMTDGSYAEDKAARYMGVFTNPVYVGDWFTREITDFDGQRVTIYYAVTVLRDQNDEVQVVEIGFDAQGMKLPHLVHFSTKDPSWREGGAYVETGLFILYQVMEPGMELDTQEVSYPYKDKVPVVPPPSDPNDEEYGTTEYEIRRLTPWLLLHPMEGQLTHEEGNRAKTEPGWWPDRVVVSNEFGGIWNGSPWAVNP